MRQQVAITFEPHVLNVRMFGARGDGSAPINAALTRAAQEIGPRGGTIVFPPGVYEIAGALELSGLKHVTLMGHGATILSTEGSGAVGHMLQFEDCEDLTIVGLRIGALGRPTSFENALVLKDCRDVRILNNRFEATGNKHIHVGGSISGLLVSGNTFEDALINATTTLDNHNFGAVYFGYDVGAAAEGVRITNNVFRRVGGYGVSINDFRAVPDAYVDIQVTNNRFEECAAGVLVRGERVRVEANTFERCGRGQLTQHYTWQAEAGGWQSHIRIAAGRPPGPGEVVTFHQGAVVEVRGRDIVVAHNDFIRCSEAQASADDPLATTITHIIGGRVTERLTIEGNLVDEAASTALTDAYWIRVTALDGDPAHCRVTDNRFRFGDAVNGSRPLIALTGDTHVVHGNEVDGVPPAGLYGVGVSPGLLPPADRPAAPSGVTDPGLAETVEALVAIGVMAN